MATGIFFVLFLLEVPIYKAVGGKETDLTNSDPLMRLIVASSQGDGNFNHLRYPWLWIASGT